MNKAVKRLEDWLWAQTESLYDKRFESKLNKYERYKYIILYEAYLTVASRIQSGRVPNQNGRLNLSSIKTWLEKESVDAYANSNNKKEFPTYVRRRYKIRGEAFEKILKRAKKI